MLALLSDVDIDDDHQTIPTFLVCKRINAIFPRYRGRFQLPVVLKASISPSSMNFHKKEPSARRGILDLIRV